MTSDEIEATKLQIERERLEADKGIENAKLEIEKLKLKHEQKFWNRNSGALIAAFVSLAAVIVSSGQVISTWVSQNRQLELATLQKGQELEMIEKQKEKELTLLDENNKRDWYLNAAKFVADNRKVLFRGTPQEKELLARMIGTIYPPNVATSLLAKLENSSPTPKASAWRKEREKIVRPAYEEQGPANTPPLKQVPPSTSIDNSSNKYVSEKVGIGCASKIQGKPVNDATNVCYLVAAEPNFCYYECYPQ
jgi:hypothetical protein